MSYSLRHIRMTGFKKSSLDKIFHNKLFLLNTFNTCIIMHTNKATYCFIGSLVGLTLDGCGFI